MTPDLLAFRPQPPLELWGGVECTFNRVGDEYFNQFRWSGHEARLCDLDAFAGLGIRTMRYPVLWESIAPDHPEERDWTFSDERLGRLRELDITPIAGLVHHGSGPRYTDLLDPCFPEKLADHARAVATRYPWLQYYTPVNEPLTTARFSALYGHWYPHHRDPLSFARALLNQVRGVMLAMTEIRRINPDAQLVQTEDMGRIWSTPTLAYQADFENERRWISFDLLCGRVGRDHPMAHYFQWTGMLEHDFLALQETPCPPDIMGLNYYLTSERFLDEHLDCYSPECRGGNGRHEYADVEAVRVCTHGIAGAGSILDEAWKRYGLPLAITEAHLGCTRDEQARWLWEIWNEAKAAQREGADVRAVTVWALLGSYNWNNLVTKCDGNYEPGAFDMRTGAPYPTFLAQIIQDLATGKHPIHPVLATPGWWRQPERLHYVPVQPHQKMKFEGSAFFHEPGRRKSHGTVFTHSKKHVPPILITDETSVLGGAFTRVCRIRYLPHQGMGHQQMDITDAHSVSSALDKWQPWAVINTAGYEDIDGAESDPETCFRINTSGAEILAQECARRGIILLNFSSDQVFDGEKTTPYLESDKTCPLSIYGRSKADAETRVLAAHPSALVVRTSELFGPFNDHNFPNTVLRILSSGDLFDAANDVVLSPTYVSDLVHFCLDLLLDGASGIRHLANAEALTWEQFAHRVAEMAGSNKDLIIGRSSAAMNWLAPRPKYAALSSERGLCLPAFEDVLHRYWHERNAHLEHCRRMENMMQPELVVNGGY